MDTTTVQPHPGAQFFSEEARRAVAEGPLFDKPHLNSNTMLTCDGVACVVMRLAEHDHVDWSRFLSTDFTQPDPIIALQELNDMGHYADRATLRRDLLGEVTP